MTKLDEAIRLLKEGKEPKQVEEMVPCSRATVWRAEKIVEGEKARPVTPEFEVEEEEVPEERLPPLEPEAPVEEEGLEEEEEIPLEEIPEELTKEQFLTFMDAICGKDTLGDRYGFESKQVKTLSNLWFPVVIRHWEKFVEKWGLEAMAILGTIVVCLPKIRLLIEDIKVYRKAKPEKEEKERPSREGGF